MFRVSILLFISFIVFQQFFYLGSCVDTRRSKSTKEGETLDNSASQEENNGKKNEAGLQDENEARLPDENEARLPDANEAKSQDKNEARFSDKNRANSQDKNEAKFSDKNKAKSQDKNEARFSDKNNAKSQDKNEARLPDKKTTRSLRNLTINEAEACSLPSSKSSKDRGIQSSRSPSKDEGRKKGNEVETSDEKIRQSLGNLSISKDGTPSQASGHPVMPATGPTPETHSQTSGTFPAIMNHVSGTYSQSGKIIPARFYSQPPGAFSEMESLPGLYPSEPSIPGRPRTIPAWPYVPGTPRTIPGEPYRPGSASTFPAFGFHPNNSVTIPAVAIRLSNGDIVSAMEGFHSFNGDITSAMRTNPIDGQITTIGTNPVPPTNTAFGDFPNPFGIIPTIGRGPQPRAFPAVGITRGISSRASEISSIAADKGPFSGAFSQASTENQVIGGPLKSSEATEGKGSSTSSESFPEALVGQQGRERKALGVRKVKTKGRR